ncbi:MAG: hypothetical protein P1V97_00875 [Planctomycetota bacterium]|nr:hypothetical protein [Planctomycetota bacterium]
MNMRWDRYDAASLLSDLCELVHDEMLRRIAQGPTERSAIRKLCLKRQRILSNGEAAAEDNSEIERSFREALKTRKNERSQKSKTPKSVADETEHCKVAVEEIYAIDKQVTDQRRIITCSSDESDQAEKTPNLVERNLRYEFNSPILDAISRLMNSSIGADCILALLRGPELNWLFYDKLERALWRIDKEKSRDWLLEELKTRTSFKGSMVLSYISGQPEVSDETLLRFAFQNTKPAIRYMGLVGLACLDLKDRNELAQRGLVDEDIYLNLRAHGLLAECSEEGSILFLSRRANDLSAPMIERAESLRWLAHADPVKHFAILAENLVRDEGQGDGYHQPVREECAYGVARVATDEALTFLVRAKFCKTSDVTRGALSEYINKIVDWNSSEDRSSPPDYYHRIPRPKILDGRAPITLFPNVWRGTSTSYPGWYP